MHLSELASDLPHPRDLLTGYAAVPVLAGESGGVVARLDAPGRPRLYLKHGTGPVAEDITDEMARLAWAARRVPVPEIRFFTRTPAGAWLLSTAVAGESVDEIVEAQGPAWLPSLIEPIAAFLRRLHALPVEDCPFLADADLRLAGARRNLDAGRVDADDFDGERAGWTPEQVWAEAVRLRPSVRCRVVTHGDFSLGNILIADGAVSGIIDLGRLGVADPYQDLAIIWSNLEEEEPGLGDRFLEAYGVDEVDRDRLAFHLCLDEMF